MGRKKKERRGRPRTRFFPTKAQYQQMVSAACRTLVEREKWLIAVIPRTMRLDGMGFPSLWPTEQPDTYKINARLLLDWLHKHGHCAFDGTAFVARRGSMLMWMWNLENKFGLLDETGYNAESTKEGNTDGLL